MMTLERQMEYLRGRPVAKERPVTLSDFDKLLYEEHSLYQLFEYQGFLHQLSWTEGFCVDAVVQDFFCALVSVDRAPEVQLEVRGVQFLFSADVIADFLNCPRPESPCFPTVPLTDEQRTSEQDLWTLMTGKTSAVNSFHESSVHALTGSADADRFSLYMFELIMDEAWEIKEYSLPYGVFLTQFLISRGVVIAARIHADAVIRGAAEGAPDRLRWGVHCDNAAQQVGRGSYGDVNEQLEEIKKTLDDFKMEADPQRIPGDIPDDVATFRDAVRR
ncbi:hypothetical protein CJ030_MR4G025774 [Morella rubra]|uniref:Uncharacterized protein n=1 Tax=Morella rubra TaxID=262757 RepID=A0A6A1VV11_9ROSI|nr:hypothetical protein CJ030_MR4G025774 [Morella rubra]